MLDRGQPGCTLADVKLLRSPSLLDGVLLWYRNEKDEFDYGGGERQLMMFRQTGKPEQAVIGRRELPR